MKETRENSKTEGNSQTHNSPRPPTPYSHNIYPITSLVDISSVHFFGFASFITVLYALPFFNLLPVVGDSTLCTEIKKISKMINKGLKQGKGGGSKDTEKNYLKI